METKKRKLTFFVSLTSVGFFFQPITLMSRSVDSEFRSTSSGHNTAINWSNKRRKIPSALKCLFPNEDGPSVFVERFNKRKALWKPSGGGILGGLHITNFNWTNVRKWRNYRLLFFMHNCCDSVRLIHHTKLWLHSINLIRC